MSSSLTRVVSSLLLLSMFGIGCVSSSSSIHPVGCAHEYYPLRTGYVATYKDSYRSLTDGASRVDHYRSEVTSVTSDAVQLALRFDSGLTSTQTLRCASDGSLTATAYSDGSAQGLTMETLSANGSYLPSDLNVGSKWQQTFEVLLHPSTKSDAPLLPEIHAQITIDHEAVSEEAVTVPSGSYRAIKVENKAHTLVRMTGSAPSSGDGQLSFTSIEWWVKDVGLVKSQTTLINGYTATAEAEAITLP